MCWRPAEPQLETLTLVLAVPMSAPRMPGCLAQSPVHMEARTPAALRPEVILSAAPSVRTLPCDPG